MSDQQQVADNLKPKKIVKYRSNNYDLGRVGDLSSRKGVKYNDAVIWGGESYNAGEDGVSQLVSLNREELVRFIFIPERHKGGRMVRPHYCKGDRGKSMEFPNLETLGYWQDRGTPNNVRWICPALTRLIVFDGFGTLKERKDDIIKSAVDWANKYAEKAKSECKNLATITFALPDLNKAEDYTEILTIFPCINPMDWTVYRLFELVKKDKEDENTCQLSRLSNDVLDLILEFCHRPEWSFKWYDDSIDKQLQLRAIQLKAVKE